MPSPLFWLFSTIMLIGGIAVVAFRNPVSSALSVVTCFVGLAGLFIGLSAFFVGVIQILVYTGAVMVLFLFIIMLLDLKEGPKRAPSLGPIAAAIALVLGFIIQLVGVLSHSPDSGSQLNEATLTAAASSFANAPKIQHELMSGKLPDIHLIGRLLFREYNFPLQILGVLLLVATVGVVVLSKKTQDDKTEDRR